MAGKKAEEAEVATEDETEQEAGASFEGDEGEQGEESHVVDLSGVDEMGNLVALPRGTYECEIDQVDFAYSNRSGNPMWTVLLNVTQEGDYANRKLYHHMTFNETGLPRVKRTLSRIAPALVEQPFDYTDPEVMESLVGTPCRVRVDTRMYEGRLTNNVRDIMAAEGGGDFLNQ